MRLMKWIGISGIAFLIFACLQQTPINRASADQDQNTRQENHTRGGVKSTRATLPISIGEPATGSGHIKSVTALGRFDHPGAMPFSLCMDKKGNVLVLDQEELDSEHSLYRAVLVKVSDGGVLLFEKTLSIKPNCHVAVDSHNNIYTLGMALGHAEDRVNILSKYEEDGKVLWEKSITTTNFSFVIDGNDRIVLVYSPYAKDSSSQNVFLLCLAPDGSEVYRHPVVVSDFTSKCLAIDKRGDIYAAGDGPVVCFDSQGRIIRRYLTYSRKYATYPGGSETIHEIVANDLFLTDRVILVAGMRQIPEESRGTALLKGLSPAGAVLFSDEYDRSMGTGKSDQYLSVVGAENGAVYCLCYFAQPGSDDIQTVIVAFSRAGKRLWTESVDTDSPAAYHLMALDAHSDLILAGKDLQGRLVIDKVKVNE